MVILGAKSESGNTIHAVVGPESELFMDIHGATVIDIADLVKTLGAESPIHLCVTRCRDEAALQRQLEVKGIPFISTCKVKDQAKPEPKAADAPPAPTVIPVPGPDVEAVLRRKPARKDPETK